MQFTARGLWLRALGLLLDVLLAVAGFCAATILPAFATIGIALFKRSTGLAIYVADYAVIAAIFLGYFSTYRMIWRFTSFRDLVHLVYAISLTVVTFSVIQFTVLEPDTRISPVLVVWPALLIWMSSLLFMSAPRVVARMLDERNRKYIGKSGENGEAGPKPILLTGDPKRIELFIRECERTPNAKYQIVGIFTDEERNHGNSLHGIEVLGRVGPALLERTLERLGRRHSGPQTLVLADDHADQKTVAELLNLATTADMKLARLPPIGSFEGESSLQPVAISDLLGRPEIALGIERASGLIKGRRVLVTGAGGSIGSELSRQIASLRPALLVIADANEFNLYSIDRELSEKFPGVPRKTAILDVRDRSLVSHWVRSTQPYIVFHAAALKHVPLVEEHPTEAIKTNVFGTMNVADACREGGVAAMVTISTDKAVNPTNVMGATKRLAEAYCQGVDQAEKSTRFVTVRFGNVLGSAGSVVPLFQRQIDAGGPVTVTHPEITRYFMTIPEAVTLVLQAGAQGVPASGERGSIYLLDMGEPVRIVDLARQMIRLSGRRPDVDIEIDIIGLRPGEKLYEEVVHNDETMMITEHRSILRVVPRVTDLRILRQQIQELGNACNALDINRALRVLKLTVPEYLSDTPLPDESVAIPVREPQHPA